MNLPTYVTEFMDEYDKVTERRDKYLELPAEEQARSWGLRTAGDTLHSLRYNATSVLRDFVHQLRREEAEQKEEIQIVLDALRRSLENIGYELERDHGEEGLAAWQDDEDVTAQAVAVVEKLMGSWRSKS